MTNDIKTDVEYRKIKSDLDDKVRELAAYVQKWAEINDLPGKRGTLMVTGWLLPISVSIITSDGEFDDLLQEASEGINTYMAVGVADTTKEYWSDSAMGYFDSEED